ncbi:MAG: hypothetical protein AAF961_16740, partial [Planctomycetota bacterium]
MNKDARQAYELATKFSSESNQGESRAELRQIVESSPNPAELWERLGIQANAAADYALAVYALEHASIYKPLTPPGQLALARGYVDANHREAAKAILSYLASLPDLEVGLLEPLASCLGQCGQYEAALNICRQASERMPENPDPLIGVAHYMRR